MLRRMPARFGAAVSSPHGLANRSFPAVNPWTRAEFVYQGPSVPSSIFSTGLVGTNRDVKGSDSESFGVDPTPVQMEIFNARHQTFNLDDNGFTLTDHKIEHIDYYNNEQVLNRYYTEVEAIVVRETGAKFALAFDHNVRSKSKKEAGAHLKHGSAVQEPLVGYGIHNDYTPASACARIRHLAQPLKINDTLRAKLGTAPPIDPDQLESLISGRWALINVWRNVSTTPVKRFPLGLCDYRTTSVDDLVVFEIRYADRTGENYFIRHSPGHKWYYYPEISRDEVVLLKCWDSRGRDFVGYMPGDAARQEPHINATFVMHSGFDDLNTGPDAPDRESIEVRTAVFF